MILADNGSSGYISASDPLFNDDALHLLNQSSQVEVVDTSTLRNS